MEWVWAWVGDAARSWRLEWGAWAAGCWMLDAGGWRQSDRATKLGGGAGVCVAITGTVSTESPD